MRDASAKFAGNQVWAPVLSLPERGTDVPRSTNIDTNSMDSPMSEKCLSRFSTPVSDLDDHRQQAPSIPRRDTITSAHRIMVRRDTMQSVGAGGRPDLLQVDEEIRGASPVSRRDFEQAIGDDELSPSEDAGLQRRGSTSPALPRATGRRSQVPLNRSRDSSPSSRSTSPANSVDAFADPRRRERANTIGSKGASELDVGVQRTVSGGTHRRRPTFSNGSTHQKEAHNDVASYHNPAEDDVCFPHAEDSYKTYKIDFEELDEFVAESTKGKPRAGACRQKFSFSSQGNKPRLFTNLNPGIDPTIPKIVTNASSPTQRGSECAIDDSMSELDVKDDDPLGEKGPRERAPSLAEPNRFSFFSSEIEQTIHAADFADLLTPGTTSRDLFELPPDSGVWWMNVLNPTEEELNVFKGAFGIHRLTTEDIITQEAREKVELFKQYYFVCFRSFYQMDKASEHYMDPVNVYMVVFRQGILTFTYTQSPHAANVRKRIGKLRDFMLLGADWICYAMM